MRMVRLFPIWKATPAWNLQRTWTPKINGSIMHQVPEFSEKIRHPSAKKRNAQISTFLFFFMPRDKNWLPYKTLQLCGRGYCRLLHNNSRMGFINCYHSKEVTIMNAQEGFSSHFITYLMKRLTLNIGYHLCSVTTLRAFIGCEEIFMQRIKLVILKFLLLETIVALSNCCAASGM